MGGENNTHVISISLLKENLSIFDNRTSNHSLNKQINNVPPNIPWNTAIPNEPVNGYTIKEPRKELNFLGLPSRYAQAELPLKMKLSAPP